MARGFKAAVYNQDDAGTRIVRVEADRFADGDFGWSAAGAGSIFQGYGGLKPRHVVGVEAATGKSARAIVPDLASDIWTGAATSFTAKTDDGVAIVYVITSRVGELAHLSR